MVKVTIREGDRTETTVSAMSLAYKFEQLDAEERNVLFMSFLVMVANFSDPSENPLPETWAEVNLEGPAEELASCFENGQISPTTRSALELLSRRENSGQSNLAELLKVARKK